MEFLFCLLFSSWGKIAVPGAFAKEISSSHSVWLMTLNILMSEEHRAPFRVTL